MNDKLVFSIVKEFFGKKLEYWPADVKKPQGDFGTRKIFESDVPYQGKNYRLVFCLEDNKNYLVLSIVVMETKNKSENNKLTDAEEILKDIGKIHERARNLIEADDLELMDEIRKTIIQEISVYQQENNLSYEKLIQKIEPLYSINIGNIEGF